MYDFEFMSDIDSDGYGYNDADAALFGAARDQVHRTREEES